MASAEAYGVPATSIALFDLDGTLLDTPRAISEQMSDAVEAVTGRRPDLERTRALIGTPLEDMAAALAGVDVDTDVTRRVAAEYLSRYRDLIVPAAAGLLFPGVAAGLARLQDAGVPAAVVTSKKNHSAELILEAAGIRHHFGAVVGVDDVDHPKPHRDSADRALAILGRSSRGTAHTVIGDTEADIGLGIAIGAHTVAVSYGVASPRRLAEAGADVIVDDFDHVTEFLLSLTESEQVS